MQIKMAKSNTKIKKQAKRKTHSLLVETIVSANRYRQWKRVAEILSGPRNNWVVKNLSEINSDCIVAGKVLSDGEMNKKLKVVALGFSEKAKEKLKKAGCDFSIIIDEIKKNPEARGLEILR